MYNDFQKNINQSDNDKKVLKDILENTQSLKEVCNCNLSGQSSKFVNQVNKFINEYCDDFINMWR